MTFQLQPSPTSPVIKKTSRADDSQQSLVGIEPLSETKQALYKLEKKRKEKEAKSKTVSIDTTDLFSGQIVNGRNVQTDLTEEGDKKMNKKRTKPTNPDQLDMFSVQEIQKKKERRERHKKVELARLQRTAKRIAERMYCSSNNAVEYKKEQVQCLKEELIEKNRQVHAEQERLNTQTQQLREKQQVLEDDRKKLDSEKREVEEMKNDVSQTTERETKRLLRWEQKLIKKQQDANNQQLELDISFLEAKKVEENSQENARLIVQYAEDQARDIKAESENFAIELEYEGRKSATETVETLLNNAKHDVEQITADAQTKMRLAERVQKHEGKQIIEKAEIEAQRIQIETEQHRTELETLKKDINELRKEWNRARELVSNAQEEAQTLKKEDFTPQTSDVNDWDREYEFDFDSDDTKVSERIIRLSQCKEIDELTDADRENTEITPALLESLKNGKLLRPVIVQKIKSGSSPIYHILEGRARLIAANEVGLQRVNAYVFDKENIWNEYKPQLTGVIYEPEPETPPPSPPQTPVTDDVIKEEWPTPPPSEKETEVMDLIDVYANTSPPENRVTKLLKEWHFTQVNRYKYPILFKTKKSGVYCCLSSDCAIISRRCEKIDTTFEDKMQGYYDTEETYWLKDRLAKLEKDVAKFEKDKTEDQYLESAIKWLKTDVDCLKTILDGRTSPPTPPTTPTPDGEKEPAKQKKPSNFNVNQAQDTNTRDNSTFNPDPTGITRPVVTNPVEFAGVSVNKTQDNLFPQTVETKNKAEAQLQAENVEVQLCDSENISQNLPYLTESQQEDVLKAEKRFFDAEGKGMAFTNGTGTGKTYVGLGIAKRFAKRGKINILIVVPTYAKAVDWVNDGKNLNLEITQIKGVDDGGEEIVVTTYANFRQNHKLIGREFDLVIYDESHKLNSNGAGSETEAEMKHREVAKVPSIAYELAKRKFGLENDSSQENLDKVTLEKVIAEAKRLRDSIKVVFLSATPFSYHKNLSYADGCLFNIVEQKGGEKISEWLRSGNYDDFFITNFGYRMRNNRLTMPESGVDVGLMERNFNERLKKEGVLSCRLLEVEHDYSRDFILVDDQLGAQIDAGIKIALGYEDRSENNFQMLPAAVKNHFDWLAQTQLTEAIKAKHAVKRCEEHLKLGRKVVIFHTYKSAKFVHPFDFSASLRTKKSEPIPYLVLSEIRRFHEKYPEYLKLDLSGLHNPIETFRQEFGDQVLFFNGDVPKKKRSQAIRDFNRDDSGKNVMVVQIEAGKEGISVHDLTGNHQRVIINLALPFKPTDAMQSEGRIYRLGVQSNAIVEYLVLKTNFESMAFGNKINKRVRTAENLAFGDQSRNLEESFAGGYLNATHTSELLPVDMTGEGGVLADGKMDASSPFEQAKTFYFARQAKRSNLGIDYFATPEPLGMKMVEWANAKVNEDLLEPSAGHGAIARFFPKSCRNVFIEQNPTLAAEVAITAGEPHIQNFEDLHAMNKFNVIVMNPPFGKAGETAMEHLEKAFNHLRFNGRIVAILPTGSTVQKFERWYQSKEKAYKVAEIALPSCTFSRAGTKVASQIVVLDKYGKSRSASDYPDRYDFRDVKSVNELFNRIGEIDVTKRNA